MMIHSSGISEHPLLPVGTVGTMSEILQEHKMHSHATPLIHQPEGIDRKDQKDQSKPRFGLGQNPDTV